MIFPSNFERNHFHLDGHFKGNVSFFCKYIHGISYANAPLYNLKPITL